MSSKNANVHTFLDFEFSLRVLMGLRVLMVFALLLFTAVLDAQGCDCGRQPSCWDKSPHSVMGRPLVYQSQRDIHLQGWE